MNQLLNAIFISCSRVQVTLRIVSSVQLSVRTSLLTLTQNMPDVHPAFENCGVKQGLEIWRIEDFQPVPVAESSFGKFYTGDSYIVLKTTGIPASLTYDIHFWLGSATSQDEAGAAAILSVNLDDGRFQGAAVQHREAQGHESEQFLKYFQPTIRYLSGGHASGFSHVTTNAGAETRLFQIKGKRNVRVTQIEAHVSKMNNGDCFILDKDHNIFVFVGQKAKGVEKMKAISVANQIRDQDHNGRAEIEIIDAYSSGDDSQKFFEALGSGDMDSVPSDEEGGDDEDFEKGVTKEVKLFEISDDSGSMTVTEKPIEGKEQLDSGECYILDAGSSGVYVWVGKNSNTKEKSEAMSRAEQYLKLHNCPAWVHVSKIPEGVEPTSFKVHFPDWS
ncbi:gelsolin-like isoform X1 [Choristoneura fumiferana]|uniref:gelsolin-like isoform X1 n=2 Tax=Choristoneura fumiferana TaxID=7141 RepID=UPI003D156FC9